MNGISVWEWIMEDYEIEEVKNWIDEFELLNKVMYL